MGRTVITVDLAGCCGRAAGRHLLTYTRHLCRIHDECLPTYQCQKDAQAETVESGEWAQPCQSCPDFETYRKDATAGVDRTWFIGQHVGA